MAREKITIDSGMPSSGAIGRFFGGAAEQAAEYVQANFPGVAQNMQHSMSALTGAASILEPAQQIVAGAKTLMSDPLRYLSQAATKAIPAAIAASASLQYTGGQGSFCNFLYPVVVRTKWMRVDGNRAAYIGKPLCKVRPLSVLTGYCKCANVKLDLPGTAQEPTATIEELQIVVRYLEAGVFLE